MNKRPAQESPPIDVGYAIREMAIEDLPKVFALGQRLFTAEKWPRCTGLGSIRDRRTV